MSTICGTLRHGRWSNTSMILARELTRVSRGRTQWFVRITSLTENTLRSSSKSQYAFSNWIKGGQVRIHVPRSTPYVNQVLVVVWLDTGKPLSPNGPGPWSKVLRENQRTRNETFLPWIQSHAFAALDAASLAIAQDRRPKKEVEQSASLLHLDYGKTLEKQIMSHDPFYALHELLQSFAYSEAQFLNVIESKINEDIAKEFTPDHNISPANMIYFQGLLDRHAEKLWRNITTIKARDGSAWPRASDERMSKKTAAHARSLLQDYEGLLKRTETLSNTCKARLQILMSRAGIVESNKAIEQAKVVTKLTRLAFIFIPLSFVSSFFGMNLTPLIDPPGFGLWLFFAVSAPVVALLLLSMYCDFENLTEYFHSWGSQRKTNTFEKAG